MTKLIPFPIKLNLSEGVVIDRPQLATVKQTCKIFNCGRTSVFAMLKSGILERRKIGRATRITVASIERLLRNEPAPIDVEFTVVSERGNS